MVKCPKCKVDYVEAECDFEYQGVLFRNVKCERCPKCGDEVYIYLEGNRKIVIEAKTE